MAADLLDSLLPPLSSQASTKLAHHSSNESFHSTTSQIQPIKKSTASAVPVRDINDYINDPANVALLAEQTSKKSYSGNNGPWSGATNLMEPVLLETNSSGFVSALHEACQAKGIQLPVYNFDQRGDGHFTEVDGTVQIGEMVFTTPHVYRSKKSAKEALSELALPQVREMPARRHDNKQQPSSPKKKEEEAMLWASRLNEYLLPRNSPPTYQTYALGLQFSAVLTFSLHPDLSFGSKTVPFPSKKEAHTAAAKEAVLFLIKEGHLNEDGRPAKKRKISMNASPNSNGKASSPSSYGTLRLGSLDGDGGGFTGCIEVPSSMTSITQRVAELARILGLMPPRYQLAPAAGLQGGNILDGHAVIDNAGQSGLPGIAGPIGKIDRVYGKNNAKSEIAGHVWEVLVEAARTRGFDVREVEV